MEHFWIQFLATIAILIPAMATFVLGVKNLRAQNKLIMDKLEGLNVVQVDMSFDIKDIKFEREILNLVTRLTTHTIGYSKSLNQLFKDSMVFFSKLLEDVLLNYYYSDARGDKYDISQQVVTDFNSLKREFYQYLTQLFTIKRVFTYDTGVQEEITFSEFVRKSNFNDRIELLSIKLIQNGYDTKEKFKTDVKEFTNKILERYVDLADEWGKLPVPKKKEEPDKFDLE